MEEVIVLETSKLVVTSQPIKEAQKEDIDRLFVSIKEVGLLYPLLVRPIEKGKYEVLDGRTRLRILRDLNYATVKCIVRKGEEEKDELVPYDVETCRRHLTKKEVENFEKIRQQKKQEAEKTLISQLTARLPRRFRRKAEKYAEMIPSGGKQRFLNFLATLTEPDLENHLEQLELAQNYTRVAREKQELQNKIKELEDKQSEEVERRVKKFEEDYKERYNKVKEQGLVIPEDPEERTSLMKKIEAVVREDMREEFDQLEKVMEQNMKMMLDLNKEVSDKEEELRIIRERNKDLDDHIGMLDDIREHFNIMLNKSVDIKPITNKTRLFHSDLDAFSGRLHEWRNRPNVSGRGIFEDMTEENIYLLVQELNILKKKISEIQSQLKR